MNKIKCINIAEVGYCIVCGKRTKHTHQESKKGSNHAYVCNDCCKGEVKIKEGKIRYYCEECDEDINNPGKVAGGIFVCPTCRGVLEEIPPAPEN